MSHSPLEEYKTQASLLLKQLHAHDADAIRRFEQLPHPITDISQVQLKHALHVIALEHQFDTWADFKKHLDRKEKLRLYRETRNQFTPLYPPRCRAFINEWHVDYEIASLELGRTGGYLLPYKNQYFICQAAYISTLGLDPDDPDWALIGWNWIKPANQEAWERLNHQLQEIEKNDK